MTSLRSFVAVLAVTSTLALAPPAAAEPPGPGGGPGMRHGGRGPGMNREKRVEMLRRMRTMRNVELGALLGLDTAGTLKLAERLAPFDEQRERLQMENFDTMMELRRMAREGGKADKNDLASRVRRIATNRVALAQVDQKELEEILAIVPPDKLTQALSFIARFPRRMERMARQFHGGWDGPPGGPEGPDGPDMD